MRSKLSLSERRICRVLGQHRSTQRRRPRGRKDGDRLVSDMIELVRQYGRYGYRRIAALLRDAGWQVNDKRIERLWRREGLESTHETTEERPSLVERWVLHTVAARVPRSCLVV